MPAPKFRHAVRFCLDHPWAIVPEKLDAINDLLTLRAAGQRLSREEIALRIGGRPQRAPAAQAPSRVALIPIQGVLAQRMGALEAISGGTSTSQIQRAVVEAASNPEVRAIVFDVDSPGGSVYGIEELSAAIRAAGQQKPTIAVANSQAASGALWLASQAQRFYVAPNGMVGSLGVVYTHVDHSQAEAKAGRKTTFVTAGQYKVDGTSAAPLSDAHRADMQGKVDAYYQRFLAAVAAGRGVSTSHAEAHFGQGRMLLDEQAVAVGLADGIRSLEDVLAEFGVSQFSEPLPSAAAWETAAMFHEHLIRLGLVGLGATEAEQLAAARAYLAARGEDLPADRAQLEARIAAATKESFHRLTVGQVDQPLAPVAAPAPLAASGDSDRAGAILAAVRLANLNDGIEVANRLVADRSMTVERALAEIQALQAAERQPTGTGRAAVTEDARDKFRAVASDALMLGALGGRRPAGLKVAEGAEGAHWMQSAQALCEYSLELSGATREQVRRLSGDRFGLAMLAMGFRDPAQHGIRLSGEGPTYNNTGMFPSLMLDASNKTLMAGYQFANTTYQIWATRGEPINDFKLVNRIKMGEIGSPKAIPEDGEFEEVTLSDDRESYKLTVWGSMISLTMQMVVNDDLMAFLRLQDQQGRAMRYKENQLTYQVLKDNPLMRDGVALFHSTHANLAGANAAVTKASLDLAYQAMYEQTGLDSDQALNIMPRWLLLPPGIAGNAETFFASPGDPAVGGSAVGTSAVTNIYGPNGTRRGLTPVVDGQLSTGSGGDANAWFLVSDQLPGIEYANLRGLESPTIESERSFDRLAIRTRNFYAFAAAPVEHRSLYKNAGA